MKSKSNIKLHNHQLSFADISADGAILLYFSDECNHIHAFIELQVKQFRNYALDFLKVWLKVDIQRI